MQRWALALSMVIVFVDQLSKQIAVNLLFVPPKVVEVTSFFNFVPVRNMGISFGLFSGDAQTSRWILVLVAVVIIIALFVWMSRVASGFVISGLALVVGGAISNVLDRVISGAVIDFLDFHFFGVHWPAFNLADTAIVIGVAILLYDGLFGPARTLK